MWVDSRARLLALTLLVGACMDFGSSSSDGRTTVVTESPPRVLDEVCAQGHYQLEGDARRGPGLTPDSCGFELGPGGVFSFPASDWPAIPADTGYGGSVEVTALVVELDGGAHDAHWIHASIVDPDDNPDWLSAETTVHVSAGNQHLGVVDLHVKTTQILIDDYNGCSVAHRRRAPRDRAP